ncbi:Fic family protein [Pseudocnuella soli]|uniref:Fic family protein n=1 Tax=Pseudocnuella soli TaxID=2502779 RepID=UPI00195C4568|nr:Fic family protein [Pseudocnuella soli]
MDEPNSQAIRLTFYLIFEPNNASNRIMATYNWQQQDWPQFTYSLQEVEDDLLLLAEKTGKLTGLMGALPEETRMEALIELIVAEAIKTSEIEGAYLSRKDVMSSIKNNLGINSTPEAVKDQAAEGIGVLMISVRNTYKEPLSEEVLFSWHGMLFKGQSGFRIGSWREHKEPMQVVTGALGKQKVHFEAPPSERVPAEMNRFITWFNETVPGGPKGLKKAAVRSAIAHLYFETIHPFEDGNGRIGRALAEKALSQGIGRPVLLSLSRTIEGNRNAYYDALSQSQRSNEITPWIAYFIRTVLAAQTEAEEQLEFTLRKAKFFDRYKDKLSERQLKVIRRMLEEGPKGFQGGMNAGKYGSLTKVSKATATRDLQALLEMGALIYLGEGGGRSIKYGVNLV